MEIVLPIVLMWLRFMCGVCVGNYYSGVASYYMKERGYSPWLCIPVSAAMMIATVLAVTWDHGTHAFR